MAPPPYPQLVRLFLSCLSVSECLNLRLNAWSRVVFVPTGEPAKCLLVNSLSLLTNAQSAGTACALTGDASLMVVSVLQESYRQVMKMRPKDLWKRLMVKFRGEEGLDYGGVAR